MKFFLGYDVTNGAFILYLEYRAEEAIEDSAQRGASRC